METYTSSDTITLPNGVTSVEITAKGGSGTYTPATGDTRTYTEYWTTYNGPPALAAAGYTASAWVDHAIAKNTDQFSIGDIYVTEECCTPSEYYVPFSGGIVKYLGGFTYGTSPPHALRFLLTRGEGRGKAPHHCTLESVASYLCSVMHADVRIIDDSS